MFRAPSKSQDLFNLAAARGDVSKMGEIIATKKNVVVNFLNDEGESPLIFAAKNGHFEAVSFLLQNGAEVSLRKRESDFAAIHHAAFRGHLEVVMALISWDSSCLNMVCGNGHNALHIAVENGRKTCEVIRYLIDAGSDVNSRTTNGNSPLILSLMNNDPERAKSVSEILLGSDDIDVNLRNNKGETALHWAAQKNIIDVVYSLLLRGADVNAADIKGKTPRDYSSSDEVVNMLDLANFPNAESVVTRSATNLKSMTHSR